jgi:peroxiredoxin (alkyl hydroperoxide reductase subunit C)
MSVLVGRPAPDFKAQAVLPDGSFKQISLADYKGKYVVLFFYPLDFTFVCPSEIIAFDHKVGDFRERHCELIGVSVDSHFSHHAWRNTPIEKGGIGKVQYPLVADLTKSIARDYDVLVGDGSVAYRGLFLIDKQGVVRHQTVNDLPLGRNVYEALRMVDALQYFEKNGEVCPANWNPGKKGMKANAEGVASYLAAHAKEL